MANLTKYSLDCETRSSYEMGQLVPFLCQEVVPGDKYRVQSSSLIRMMPMLAPLMHRIDYIQRFYYVPYRLLCPNYEKMVTDPDGPYKVPDLFDYLPSDKTTVHEFLRRYPLLPFFGLKSEYADKDASKVFENLNAFPILAYYLIYNHYYLRSDIDPLFVDDFEPDTFFKTNIKPILGKVLYVNQGYDYFTSAKKETQYGDMVQLDMDGNNTITVPEMRIAERLQSFRERLLRVGNRYISYLKEFFDASPTDLRVMKPRYIGGDEYVLNVSDVDQTALSEKQPMGSSAGKSVSVNRTGEIEFDVYEHGLIIGLHFVRPRVSNIGGCPKMFTRKTYYDFFNPHFTNLGFQEISNRELDPSRTGVFGYVPRYDELRFGSDIVSGDFARSLNYWHLSRDISDESLSSEFLKSYPDNRIFPVSNVSNPLISDLHVYEVFINKASVGTSKEVDFDTLSSFLILAFAPLPNNPKYLKKTIYIPSSDGLFNFRSLTPTQYAYNIDSYKINVSSNIHPIYYEDYSTSGHGNGCAFHLNSPIDQSDSDQAYYPSINNFPLFEVISKHGNFTIPLQNVYRLEFTTMDDKSGNKSNEQSKITIPYIPLEKTFSYHTKDGFNGLVYTQCGAPLRLLFSQGQVSENNHILSTTYNKVDVLRNLPNIRYDIIK